MSLGSASLILKAGHLSIAESGSSISTCTLLCSPVLKANAIKRV
jgi:hypothetical protein